MVGSPYAAHRLLAVTTAPAALPTLKDRSRAVRGAVQKVMLSDFRGQPVILAFYPEDSSPVCSDQLGLYLMRHGLASKRAAEVVRGNSVHRTRRRG
jgi:peroxiredoxin